MMAPEPAADAHFPDAPNNEAEFLADLQRFHSLRGTNLDLEPKVNMKPISLWELFQDIEGRGGYDKVSAEKLLWRKIALDFNLGTANAAAYAFALKTIYYRNLAAYAIKRVHKQEPPPKEILENTTAKGADLLNRTTNNYHLPSVSQHTNGQEGEESSDDKTPKVDKIDMDDPSSTGRATRGLRQAPPQRVLFQPDISSSRQPRQVSSHTQSPQPMSHATASAAAAAAAYSQANNPALNPNSSSFNIANYEPRQPIPLTLRPVPTPLTNPAMFAEKAKRMKEAILTRIGKMPQKSPIMLPGTGFEGPNIYQRTLLSLRCGIPHEVAYALHHLVKISHERGDKYKFESFPGLCEGLIEQVLLISRLLNGIEWEINYDEFRTDLGINVLNGHDGTADILDRIESLKEGERDPISADLIPQEFDNQLTRCNEAGLVLRNMSMLEDNASFLSEMAPIRDLVCIVLGLPSRYYLVELKHYILDICEQLTKYWHVTESAPVYQSLVRVLQRGLDLGDRGSSLISMRALARFSINLDTQSPMKDIPIDVIKHIMNWTMLEDEKLVLAVLDFIYQFTSVPENMAALLVGMERNELNLHHFLQQLGKLLTFEAVTTHEKRLKLAAVAPMTTTEIQNIPSDLLEEINPLPEPERSSAWLRSLFEEHEESDITQIALWQAYQARFTSLSTNENPLLPAAEFIKNVSTTFPSANAQVINGPTPRFIIKGIRPRFIPVDTKGNRCLMCLWKPPGSFKTCGVFHCSPHAMWNHLVSEHVGADRAEDGKFSVKALNQKFQGQNAFECHWGGCLHYSRTTGRGTNDSHALCRHVGIHLPDRTRPGWEQREKTIQRPTSNQRDGVWEGEAGVHGFPAEYEYITYTDTAVDERGEPTGLANTSLLVLKNIARSISKSISSGAADDLQNQSATGGDGWISLLYEPLRPRLIHVVAYNRSLSGCVLDLMALIDNSIDNNE